ncbi:hypothetical protein DFH07DRAFT_997632 [Mycena maculata]|uniref:Uncharacterized protein n=1 Tax=Mycena maculata TaxID=230809 RepID=A0AAD7JU74_9AGAR|nr:hypothetical protein DFH07DRAFT_997632 [Mycena maculata]
MLLIHTIKTPCTADKAVRALRWNLSSETAGSKTNTWSDIGHIYNTYGPIPGTLGGWDIRGTAPTVWDVDSSPTTNRTMEWTWLDDSGVPKLWVDDIETVPIHLLCYDRSPAACTMHTYYPHIFEELWAPWSSGTREHDIKCVEIWNWPIELAVLARTLDSAGAKRLLNLEPRWDTGLGFGTVFLVIVQIWKWVQFYGNRDWTAQDPG